MFSYSPKFSEEMHKIYDLEPKKWCCSNSDNCNLYLAARPIDYCLNYDPLLLGKFSKFFLVKMFNTLGKTNESKKLF